MVHSNKINATIDSNIVQVFHKKTNVTYFGCSGYCVKQFSINDLAIFSVTVMSCKQLYLTAIRLQYSKYWYDTPLL